MLISLPLDFKKDNLLTTLKLQTACFYQVSAVEYDNPEENVMLGKSIFILERSMQSYLYAFKYHR